MIKYNLSDIKNRLLQFENFNNEKHLNYLCAYIDKTTTEAFPKWLSVTTTIGSYAFYGCRNLTNVTIPDSVTTIGERAFSSCNSLTNITIPDSVTTIGSEAFSSCHSLTNITIPDSVTRMGRGVLSNCVYLTDIYVRPTIPPTLDDIHAFPSEATIHVPIGSGDAYKSATNWSSYANKIIEDIEI